MKKRRKKKKKINLLLLIFLILVIISIGIIIYFLSRDTKNKDNKISVKVTLIDNLDIEVGSEIKVNSLIENIENGSIIDNEEIIDTSEIGEQEITIKLLTKEEKEEKYTFEINVIDNIKPNIESDDTITTTVCSDTDLLKYVTVTDNYDKELDIKVEGNYDVNNIGEYKLTYIAKDSSNNESRKDFTLVVEKSKYKKMCDKTITTEKGYTLEIKDGVAYVEGILIANKTYYLPENYTPVNSYAKLSDNCPNCLEVEVMEKFNEMKADMQSIGLKIWLASGYRSYNTQKYLYNSYVSRDGKEEADTYSARPGHSEHQTGLAFDLNEVNSSFDGTDESNWIKDNCYKYGFIIRYPKGKEKITGYMYEPWHLRYVGKDLAEKIYNKGNWLTLEEYFGITSVYED